MFTSITMPQAPIASNVVIAFSNSSRTTACTRISSDSFIGEVSSRMRLSKNASTPATPVSSTSTPPSTCAAVRPSG